MHNAVTSRVSARPGTTDHRLSDRQIAILVSFGLVFWLVAALFIRIAPFGVFERGAGTVVLFASSVPVAWLSVGIARWIATLAPAQLVAGVAVASAAAMLCDGVGLIWWSVYGDGDRLPGAAWLLWGVGLILFAAFLDARRQGS